MGKVLIPLSPLGFWDFYGDAPPPAGLQRLLVGFIEKDIFSAQLLKLDTNHQARACLLSSSAKNAGAWLTTLPSCKEFMISDTNYRLAARFRLGLAPHDDLPKQCQCQTLLSSDPAHFLSCKSFRHSPVNHRHGMQTQLLVRLIHKAGGTAYLEPSWIDQKRPDIHATFPDARFVIDNSYTHSAAPSHCRASAFHVLHAAKKREATKTSKYQAMAAAEDCKFVPFVQETYGGLGIQAKRFISELVRQSKEHSAPSVTRFRDYAIRALAVCLVNGNCFVQHAGCLRLRAWDGRFRRDRSRLVSRSFSYRPRPSTYAIRPSSPPPSSPSSIE